MMQWHSEPVYKINELVTDQDSIGAEEERQHQSGAYPIHEFGPGKKDEGQNAKSREDHFAGSETKCAPANDRRHHRIYFDGTHFEELKCEKGIQATHQHDANGQKEQPGVMPVRKDRLNFIVTSGFPSTRSNKTEDDGLPGERTPVQYIPIC